jgi:replicative DNA helicase
MSEPVTRIQDYLTDEQAAALNRRANGHTTDPERVLEAIGAGDDAWPLFPANPLPVFPVEALPSAVAAWAQATSLYTQTPVDVAALAALGVLSAAALGAAVVDCGQWEEELGLYLLPALPSGERKSTVLKVATQPLKEVQRELQEAAEPRVREQLLRRDVLETRKRKRTKTAAESSVHEDRLEAENDLAACAAELAEIGDPVPPRLFADDATPEALGKLLAENGSIAALEAESALIDNLLGRYNDGKANLHVVCKAYSGEPTTIDRKGHVTEYLERPLLTIALTVQPHVIKALVSDPVAREQGLVARFAFALPETRLGRRSVNAPAIQREVTEAWRGIVRRVAALKAADTTDTNPGSPSSVGSVGTSPARRITLTKDASNLLTVLRAQLEPRLAPDADLHHMADWIGRHPGRVARIAGLLHLCGHPVDEPIDGPTMRAALRIGDYLLAHSTEALTTPDPKVRSAIRWLRRLDEATVTVRDIHRGPFGARGPVEKPQELVETLEGMGALRRLPPGPPKPGHPPSPTYEINPNLRQRSGGEQ